MSSAVEKRLETLAHNEEQKIQDPPILTAIAPEGGWGYLVMTGMILCFIATFGQMSCIGLMFGDFLAHLGLRTQALTALPSCYYMASSLIGAFANYLFARFSARTVGLFGAGLFAIGSLAVAVVRSLDELLIAYGLLQGCGFGIMLAVSYTTFNRYFVRRRMTMMALAQTLLGLGNMALPIGIEMLLSEYGFQGGMAVVGALNAHVLFAMLVMHPVEWHHKQVKRLRTNVNNDDGNDKVKEQERMLMLDEKLCSKVNETENTAALDHPQSGSVHGLWPRVVQFLDLGLCTDAVYVNISVGMALVLYSDVQYFTILPVYLRELGFGKMASAQVVSLCAAADLLGRFFLTIVSYAVQIRARTIFLAGVLGTMATRIVFQHVSDTLSVSVVSASMGFFRAWIHVPICIVFADHLPADRFPSGYGLYMVLQGVLMFLMGPVVGAIRDYTGSYPVSFGFLTAVLGACAIPWAVEMWAKRRKDLSNPQHTQI